MIRVALVGYTNVGKSTIMNLLSKSEVFAENKLFATLDTTVRKMVIDNLPFLLADTVGFIRKLPTDLVDSFKSTLDEVREADLLVHVVDISHPDFEEQIKVVETTLSELGCADKPSMIVFNKIDAYTWVEKEEDDLTPVLRENYSLEDLKQMWMSKQGSETVYISAARKDCVGGTLYLVGRDARTGELLGDATSCSMCRRLIINAGIRSVVIRDTDDEYREIDVEDWIAGDESLDGIPGY